MPYLPAILSRRSRPIIRPLPGWLPGALAIALATPNLHAQATTVVLVRHAEKLAPTGDPALSPAGRQRALSLAEAVAGLELDRIVVTQYRRTLETAEPAAAARRLTAQVVPVGTSLADHFRDVAAQVRGAASGSAILVVGHSNTIGPIVRALGGPEVPEICDPEYATLFLLTLPPRGPPRLLRATYGPPDPADAGACRSAARN